MRKSTRSAWLAALLYVAFIYATLSIAPAPLRFLRGHNLLRLSLGVLYAAGLISLLANLAVSGEKRWWRYALMSAVLFLYPLVARATSSPEEQLHFFEYGLVGVLFARALAAGRAYTWKTWAGALALGALAGWIDELLQGLLSNRHYDVRDIWLNVISVAMGLSLRSFLPTKASSPEIR